MPNPIHLFAFIIATMLGLGFHVLMRGDARRLVLFVVMSWLGFLLGQYVGTLLETDLLTVGMLHLLPATMSSLALMFFAHFLTAEPASAVTRR